MDELDEKLQKVSDNIRTLNREIGFDRQRRTFPDRRDRDGGVVGNRIEKYGYQEEPGIRRNIKRRFESNGNRNKDEEDDVEHPAKRITLQSMVVMPLIETKSRAERLQEITKTEKKEVVNRNRRMFSNLMGTLAQFKKDESRPNETEKKMQEKLQEVDKKLLEEKVAIKEKREEERRTKINKRKELEAEKISLTRKKALIQYADAKITQYKQMQHFIMTNTKPPLFFLPSKHNVRSLELLKNSEKTIDGLIVRRKQDLERELENPQNYHEEEETGDMKSFVAKKPEKDDGPRSKYDRHRSPQPEEEDDDEHEPKEDNKIEDMEDNDETELPESKEEPLDIAD